MMLSSLLGLYGAGLLTFASPCVLPLLPLYLGVLAGASGAGAPNPSRVRWAGIGFSLGLLLVFVAMGHLAARALSEAPGEAIDQAIGRVLGQVARGQEVTVSVHPDLAEDIETRIAARQAGDRRKLNFVVLADDALAPGDAHLRWEAGGLRLDASQRHRAVIEELTSMGII